MEFSFQLHGARKHPPLEAILAKLRPLGYSRVEGWVEILPEAKELATQLRRYDLTMPTSHISLEQLQDRDFTLRTAETLGIKMLICPWIEESHRKDEGSWTRLADTLAGLCDQYRGEGYRFGWHSHEWEFQPQKSGRMPIDILLETAPEMEWEFDIGWAVVDNIDPFVWFQKYGRRITAAHIKDIATPGTKLDEDGWDDVGCGTMDWARLYPALINDTACKFFVFEHDEPTDVMRFLTRSMDATRKILKTA